MTEYELQPSPEISLILPAYNEAGRQEDQNTPKGDAFRRAVDTYQNFLSDSFNSSELIVVDDGSTDGTADLAKELGVDRIISYPVNRGRGFGLKMAFPQAKGKKRLYADSDGSYNPSTLLGLYEAIENGADIAVAYRAGEVQHESRVRKIGHSLMHGVCELIAPTGVFDPQAGAKAFSAEAAQLIWGKYITQERWAADRQALYYARKLGMNVAQVAAEITPVGDSRVDLIRDAIDMVADSFHIRFEDSQHPVLDSSVSYLADHAKTSGARLQKLLAA